MNILLEVPNCTSDKQINFLTQVECASQVLKPYSNACEQQYLFILFLWQRNAKPFSDIVKNSLNDRYFLNLKAFWAVHCGFLCFLWWILAPSFPSFPLCWPVGEIHTNAGQKCCSRSKNILFIFTFWDSRSFSIWCQHYTVILPAVFISIQYNHLTGKRCVAASQVKMTAWVFS